MAMVFGSMLASLLVKNSQKKGTPRLLTWIPYGCAFAVGTFTKSILPFRGPSRPTKLPTCTENHSMPSASNTKECGSSAFLSGILYSLTSPVFASSLPMYPLKFPVNQMLSSESATSPCGPELSTFRGNSLNAPVDGSTRPILFCICSVNQSAPSIPTAGSCGWAPLVGTSHSLMVIFSSPTSVLGDARREPMVVASATAAISEPWIIRVICALGVISHLLNSFSTREDSLTPWRFGEKKQFE